MADLHHYLRCLGKTEQCCPVGYFIKNNFKTKNGTGTFRGAFINVAPEYSSDGAEVVRCGATCSDGAKVVRSGVTGSNGATCSDRAS